MKESIGFIGLGGLGLPMAHNLLDSGYPLAVYDLTAGKSDSLVKKGARAASSPTDSLTPGGIVITILWDTDTVEKVINVDGFLERLGPGGIHLCMCTGSPDGARKLAALHTAHGSTYVEAPIFGRPEVAAAKKLWIAFDGPGPAKERICAILTALGAQGFFDFGEQIGAASMVKLVANFLLISAAESMSEGFAIADKMGVDPKVLLSMLTHSIFASSVYESYGARIVEKMPSFSLDGVAAKDLALLQSVAEQFHLPTPITQAMKEGVSNKPSKTSLAHPPIH